MHRYSGGMPNEAFLGSTLAPPRRVSTVALVMLAGFFTAVFPWLSGLEMRRPEVQVFYCCSAAVYLDLVMTKWRAPRTAFASWALALASLAIALTTVRIKIAHWIIPSLGFLLGAAILGLGVAIGFAYYAEHASGQSARQIFLFTALALFLFWRMWTPDSIQSRVDSLLLPGAMPYTGLLGGVAIAGLAWLYYGRRPVA